MRAPATVRVGCALALVAALIFGACIDLSVAGEPLPPGRFAQVIRSPSGPPPAAKPAPPPAADSVVPGANASYPEIHQWKVALDAADFRFLSCAQSLRSPDWAEFSEPPLGEPAYTAWAQRFNAAPSSGGPLSDAGSRRGSHRV